MPRQDNLSGMKSCVQYVRNLWQQGRTIRGLWTYSSRGQFPAVHKAPFIPTFLNTLTTLLSPDNLTLCPLLVNELYPLSTAPINTPLLSKPRKF